MLHRGSDEDLLSAKRKKPCRHRWTALQKGANFLFRRGERGGEKNSNELKRQHKMEKRRETVGSTIWWLWQAAAQAMQGDSFRKAFFYLAC